MADSSTLLQTLSGGESGASAPTPSPSGAPAPSPTPSASNDPWFHAFTPELKGVVEKKGWKDAQDAVKSYAELERVIGSSDKLAVPKDDNDAKGWDALYGRLGRPESADKYAFPEGSDASLVKAFAPEMHKLGLSQKQVAGLTTLQMQLAQQQIEAERVRVVNDQNEGDVKLRGEWGAKYNENVAFAQRALKGLGMSVDSDFVPLAAAIGTERAMKLLMLAGAATREDNSAQLGDTQRGYEGLSVNRARAELADRKDALRKRASEGDKAANAELTRLYKAAYPGGEGA